MLQTCNEMLEELVGNSLIEWFAAVQSSQPLQLILKHNALFSHWLWSGHPTDT